MAVQIIEGAPAVAERPHISHTQVSMVEECSLRWWLRYVCKIRKPQSIQMMTGSIVHDVLAENFIQKAISGVDLPTDDLVDMFVSRFDLRILEDSCEIPIGKDPCEFRDAAAALLNHYMQTIAIPILPKMIKLPGADDSVAAVELELRREIPGTGIDFLGYIDQWTDDDKIVDYKITTKRWGKADYDTKGRQGTAYAYLIDGLFPNLLDTTGLTAHFHVCIRDAVKPQVQVVDLHQSRAAVTCYENRLLYVVNVMRDLAVGAIEPQQKNGYCNEKLCQHYWECKDWQYGRLDAEPQPTSWNINEYSE